MTSIKNNDQVDSVPSASLRSRWVIFIEFPVVLLIFIAVAVNLPYRPIGMITITTILMLVAARFYIWLRFHVRVPMLILGLAFVAVEVDAIGNYFHWYGSFPGPVPFDVLAHAMIPFVAAPILVWLLELWFEKAHYHVPLSVITFIAVTVNFSLSGFYEVIEMWDERYFGGKRIWTLYDTSHDLQWDFAGALAGSLFSYLIWRRRKQPKTTV